jgi:hypothetical protein
MRLRLTIGATVLHADLLDNDTSRDFASLLPLTVVLTDFHATEKIGDLPRRLSTTGAPPGTAAQAGDIAYYAPWGNLAIFYQDFQYAQGLVRLGTLHTGVDAVEATPDESAVAIEAADDDTV